jgi:hypothetical protein
VTNDEGVPIADANVVLSYQPDLAAAQGAGTRTGADGRYALELNARQPGNVNALIRAIAGDVYRPFEQLIRVGASGEKNIRLRRVRTITAGQSTTVRFDADSSTCGSIGIAGICEWVRVQYPSTFTQRLFVQAIGAGTPTLRAVVQDPLFGIDWPNVPTIVVVGEGGIAIPSGDGEYWENYYPRTADVAVVIPAGTAPQQYEVIVSRLERP